MSEGRWVHLAIEQKLSNWDGWSRVYLDGMLVAEGGGATMTPYPVTRLRYGLAAIDAGHQTRPLTVHFSLRDGPLGGRGRLAALCGRATGGGQSLSACLLSWSRRVAPGGLSGA